MLRSHIFAALLAICLVFAVADNAHAIRMIDDSGGITRGDDGFGGGGGGGGTVPTVPSDPEPTTPTVPSDPQPQAPEEPSNQGGGGGNVVTDILDGLIQNITSVGTTTIELIRTLLASFVENEGGRLNVGMLDVLVDMHGQCRWLDNAGNNDIFVPFATGAEWDAFINNAPVGVTQAGCCPAATVRLTALDGQFLEIELPIGREGSTGLNGQRTVSQAFTMNRLDGGVLSETINQTFSCTGGAWTAGTPNSDVEVVSEPSTPVTPELPITPPDTCGGAPIEYETVTATWTGQWRRSWSGNSTFSSSGIASVQHIYMNDGVQTSNGSGNRSTAVFTLSRRAAAGSVKVTALYGSYSGSNADGTPGNFSDGVTPKVATFAIADTGVITAANTPATLTFHSPHRMGHPFRMTNDIVYMPSYDSSPNLRSLTIEYTAAKPCNAPVDTLVFGSNCSSPVRSCISNGTSCVSGIGPMDPVTHAGTFCSSVSNTDSGQDGATVTFDLRPQLGGRTGAALVIVPFDPWYGIRDAGTARAVMADPDSYMGVANLPLSGRQQTAIKFMIPDVSANATVNVPMTLNTGCGKDCSNNHTYNLQYTGSTKQLSVYMYKSGRWKKNTHPGCTGGNWNNQYIAGTCNGKVWSEVRVVSPAPATCGSAAGQQHMSYGVSGQLCAAGTPSEVTQTADSIGYFPAGFYRWSCSDERSTVQCEATYSDYIDLGGGYIP